ncbi:MAG: methyltransferase family protein [Ignavibacteriales bacterium]
MGQIFRSLVFLCVVTHIVRTAYELLKHKKLIRPDKLTFAIIFIDMVFMWVSWFVLCRIDPYRTELPEVINYLGGLIVLAGAVLFLTALFTIKTLETFEGNLITKGIYSKIRHPMYLGFIFWFFGGPVIYGAAASFALSLIFIANVLYWRSLEELELEKRFPEYDDYRKRTIF